MLWYRIGRGPPREYFYSNVDLLRVSQISLALSLLLFAAGLAAPPLSAKVHGFLMVAGLLSFYFSVMYLQHPAFTNTMPRRPLSYILLALFLYGLLASYLGAPLPWAPFSALYILLYLPGLRGANAPPNVLTMAGLAALAVASEPWRMVLSFPAASALSLIMRVDSAKRHLRPSLSEALAFSALYLALFFIPVPPPAAIAAIFGGFLLLVRGAYVSSEPYSWGTTIGRVLPILAPLGYLGLPTYHFLYMGIAVIMFSLCIPWFTPSVFLRAVPQWPRYLPLVPAVAALLRLTGYGPLVALSSVVLLAGAVYVSVKVLRERKFPLGQPP